ncbi:ABC transporter permease [Streptomyces sp. ODS28]|uniref:ABC transporter permease n=1 Tax=Streptomyces sp. ODS28 TaxID=3136688 RepID=UPI0031EA0D03
MTVLKTSLRGFVAHKGRMALSAVAVVLSVAFVCGTLVFSDTMTATFDRLFAATSADVTVTPKGAAADDEQPANGKPKTLPASAVRRAGQAQGAAAAEGAVSSTAVTVVNAHGDNVGSTTGAPTIAGNWTTMDRKTMDITSGHRPRGAGQVMVDADTAKKKHLKLGDELRTVAATGDHTARISGIATFRVTNPGAAIVYFDTATAQRQLLGRAGVFTHVAVTGDKGVPDAELKRNVAAELGAGTQSGYTYRTQAETSEQGQKDVAGFMDVIKYAMLGFAGIAVLVGVFLIVNTFSMLVAQRTREIGLMRAIGSSRSQINRSVLTEALLLGLVGSVFGAGAGVGLAVGLMKVMSSFGMNLSTSELTVKWTTPVAGLLLGVVVTVLAAWLPARRAARVSPMAALRDAGSAGLSGGGRAGVLRITAGVLLTGGGAFCLYAATQASKAGAGSLWMGVGVVLTLLGFIVVGPVLAAVFVRGLSAAVLRPFGRVGRLAERNALRNPRRTGATAAALMIGLALVASLSVVGSSMVASASDQLDKSVGADFIVQSDNGQLITPAAQRKMERSPDLASVTSYKSVEARITPPGGGKAEKTDLSATEPSYVNDLQRKVTSGSLAAAYGGNAMSVGSDYAKKHHVAVGDRMRVAFTDGRTASLRVAAVTSDDTTFDKGAMYVSIDTVRRYVPAAEMPLNSIMFGSAKDGREKAAYGELKDALKPYPQYQVRDQADFKKTLEDQIGQLLNIVYGLLALAIIVAVLGVVNTLALSVVERTREIGLMRAIGLSRRQLRRMVRLESVVIALFGALLGLGLGLGWGATAQKLLALEGLGVLAVPWTTILAVFAGSALVGLIAALVPAFRAGRLNVLNAIATE